MARNSLTFDLKELGEFNLTLRRVGEVPQKVVVKAAGKGRNLLRKSIKSSAPIDTGTLKGSIISTGERSRYKGKKVYDVMFDPGKNDVLQKPIKNPGEAGGENEKAYYPASIEYGFLTRSKGGGLSYVPGYHFMRAASEQSGRAVKSAIMKTVTDELEKEWMK